MTFSGLGIKMTFDEVVDESARKYLTALQSCAIGLPAQVRRLARSIEETTRAAQSKRSSLTAADVSVTPALLLSASRADRQATLGLASDHALGLGCHSPNTVFIGKEPAIGPDDAVNFILECLCLNALWLCHCKSDVLYRLVGAGGDFLRYPATISQGTYPLVRSRPGHTWHKVAKVLTFQLDQRVSYASWGDHAFLADLGSKGSKQHQGQEPSDARVSTLESMVSAFAQANTLSLVLHSQERHHRAAQQRLVAAFLGVSDTDVRAIHSLAIDSPHRREQIETWDHDHRRVIRCRHLSNAISDDFLRSLASHLVL